MRGPLVEIDCFQLSDLAWFIPTTVGKKNTDLFNFLFLGMMRNLSQLCNSFQWKPRPASFQKKYNTSVYAVHRTHKLCCWHLSSSYQNILRWQNTKSDSDWILPLWQSGCLEKHTNTSLEGWMELWVFMIPITTFALVPTLIMAISFFLCEDCKVSSATHTLTSSTNS